MKISKLVLLIGFIFASCTKIAAQTDFLTTLDSEKLEKAKVELNAAVERILSAKTPTLLESASIDAVALIASIVVGAMMAHGMDGQRIKTMDLYCKERLGAKDEMKYKRAPTFYRFLDTSFFSLVMFPFFKILIDGMIGSSENVDKDLNILVLQKDRILEVFAANKIDLNELETKINELSGDKGRFGLKTRIIQAFFLGLIIYFNQGLLEAAFVKKWDWFELKKIGITTLSMCMYFLAFTMQSSAWKKSSRLKKLDLLKQVIEQSKNKIQVAPNPA